MENKKLKLIVFISKFGQTLQAIIYVEIENLVHKYCCNSVLGITCASASASAPTLKCEKWRILENSRKTN